MALLTGMAVASTEHKVHLTRRLSTLAGVGLVVVAATGVFRAVIEVQTWANLVTTIFGVFVLLKLGLIVVLAALGRVQPLSQRPAIASGTAHLAQDGVD